MKPSDLYEHDLYLVFISGVYTLASIILGILMRLTYIRRRQPDAANELLRVRNVLLAALFGWFGLLFLAIFYGKSLPFIYR